ncbi:MAG: tetratricopeptide repeat protein [Kofleriaceae bacterium]|nr:tetratricopeptide repeat protein [Kofleriaceae bacterium]MCB9571040.1 tetratricopeptide repeat protein [Kofleriaceae bacterium]
MIPLPPATRRLAHPVPEAGGRRAARMDTDPGSSQLEVRGARSALVGRDAQLAVLHDVVSRAVDFQAPQLVTVVGNQGTGKSRLVAELAASIQPPTRVFHGRARQGGERYGAIASLLRSRFGLPMVDADPRGSAARMSLEVSAVIGGAQMEEMLHCLGVFVGVDFPATPFLQVVAENPRQMDDVARTVLRRFIELDAQQSPLILVIDDLQWADDDTLQLCSDLASGLGGSPVVIVGCTRPEMLVRCPQWGQGAVDHERLDLRNLEPEEAETMFRNLLARCGPIPDDIAEDAVEMTGGNPHFLEQLVRLFLADGTIDTSGPSWRLDVERAAATELPISIEEAIEARIAALERDERELLEKAAVFGNVFWLSAVIALTRLDDVIDERLGDALDYQWGEGEQVRRRMSDLLSILADRDYLLPLDPADSTIPGDVEVVFKHNLERELIVKSTEPQRLARFHLGAAQWLETRIGGRSEEQLEFLAGLYERGGDRERAARAYLAGGDKARARYANDEARNLYQRALELMGAADVPARIETLHNLGVVLDLGGRTDEALDRFAEMLHLAWRYDNPAKAGAAMSRMARMLRRQGQYDRAMEHLRRAHELFTRACDDRGIASTLDDMGRVHWLRGAYTQALDFLRQALTLRRTVGDRRSIALSLANIGRVHHDSGNFKAAIAQFREALDLRRDIGDMSGVVQSLCDLGGVYVVDRHFDMAIDLLEEGRAVALEIGDKMALATALVRIGECRTAMGQPHEAMRELAKARELAQTLGDRSLLADAHRWAAASAILLGDFDAAEADARAALQIGGALGSRILVAAAHRVIAEVAAGRDDRGTAEDHFQSAIEILSTMRNELELARVYRSCAAFRERIGAVGAAAEMRQQADEIFGRLRGAAETI